MIIVERSDHPWIQEEELTVAILSFVGQSDSHSLDPLRAKTLEKLSSIGHH